MGTNAVAANRRLQAAVKRAPILVAAKQRELAAFALETAVELSPVATGDYRGDWALSEGRPDGSDAPIDPVGDATIAREERGIAESPPFGVIYLSNANGAALPIEHGASDQAPLGVLGITTARVKDRIARGV